MGLQYGKESKQWITTKMVCYPYGQIKRWIVGQIQSGIWKPGHMLPSEKQLQQQFGVSRTTVRQAIAELQAEGFVEKHQGRGTLVAKPKFEWQLRKLRVLLPM